MPPWHADPRYGRFANDRSLSTRERSILLHGSNRVPPGDLPGPEAAGLPRVWSIGTPDIVFEMPRPIPSRPKGPCPSIVFRVATGFTEDLYVQAVEAQPGDRAVVHHITSSSKITKPRTQTGPGEFAGGLHARRSALGLPAGARQEDPSQVRLALRGPLHADRKAAISIARRSAWSFHRNHLDTWRHQGDSGHHLRIPPGDPDRVVTTYWKADRDIQLLSLTPHMHLRGKSFAFTAAYPDGLERSSCRCRATISTGRASTGWSSRNRSRKGPRSIARPTTITHPRIRPTRIRRARSLGRTERGRNDDRFYRLLLIIDLGVPLASSPGHASMIPKLNAWGGSRASAYTSR